MIIHSDDGRYAHMPNCNERCSESGHWLEQSVPAPWQVQSSQLTLGGALGDDGTCPSCAPESQLTGTEG